MSELTFLCEKRHMIIHRFLEDQTLVTMDGPYGKDIKLHKFSNVNLIAEGSGIAGIVPFALAIAERRYYDKQEKRKEQRLTSLHLDDTRKLTVFWAMDDNEHLYWATQQIDEIMDLDPGLNKALLQFVILAPQKINEQQRELFRSTLKALVKYPKNCRIYYTPKAMHSGFLKEQLYRILDEFAGDMATAVCGTVGFQNMVQDIVGQHERKTTFFHLEHEPRPMSKADIMTPAQTLENAYPTNDGLIHRGETRKQANLAHVNQGVRKSILGVIHREDETNHRYGRSLVSGQVLASQKTGVSSSTLNNS
ncbi:hypothetical protein S7711_11074 [Stachybotrys chartarum IBT 7711]|uniref:Ferric reductase NAD binding domain-containing protein n=1 Tax=Stachybotrys chartarum (strain CBS 109288 / IBT 7711) TaxID=1280523 RepID=A0A084B5Q9_STACB|nr:hypothetical protein S7711_11074 [Stachybotrys chartarum IBT 7711]